MAGGEGAQIDPTGAGFRAQAAAAIAAQASANLSSWSPCVPANTAAQAACEQQIISQVGESAYRRPLTADESAGMKSLFDAGIAAKDFPTGVNWFLSGVLQTPQFLYQLIQPSTTETAGQIVPITGYEMASRLSYYVWESMPDAALMTAAANGTLNDAQGIQTQFARMVQNQTASSRGITAFWYDWLQVSGYSAGLQKNLPDGTPDPAFTQDVATSLGQSILLGATSLYKSGSPNLSSLFDGESYYMNGTLQTYYKAGSGAGSSYVPTDMPNQDRHGVLTHPAFLAMNARPDVTAPILRGVFVVWNLFCLQNLQVPTNIVIPALPDFQAGLTTRQLITQTHVQAACVGCHNIIDPPGFALEGFDQNGNPRTTDNGLPVDTSNIVVQGAGDVNGTYATADEFLAKLPQSTTVRACVAQQYLERALSGTLATQPATGDTCSVSTVGNAFAKTGDLNSLIQMVATSDSFTYRQSEGAAQ